LSARASRKRRPSLHLDMMSTQREGTEKNNATKRNGEGDRCGEKEKDSGWKKKKRSGYLPRPGRHVDGSRPMRKKKVRLLPEGPTEQIGGGGVTCVEEKTGPSKGERGAPGRRRSPSGGHPPGPMIPDLSQREQGEERAANHRER